MVRKFHVFARGSALRGHARFVGHDHRQHLGHRRAHARKRPQQKVVELGAHQALVAHLGRDILAKVAAGAEQVVDDRHVRTTNLFTLLQEQTRQTRLDLGTAEAEQRREHDANTQENHGGLLEREPMKVHFHSQTSKKSTIRCFHKS